MSSLRKVRLQELMREEISKLVVEDLADPRIGFATITGVKLDDDFTEAQVNVSFLVPEDKRSMAIAALNHSASYIRYKILPFLKMRKAPKLVFILDKSIERSAEISSLIRKARESDPDTTETPPETPDE